MTFVHEVARLVAGKMALLAVVLYVGFSAAMLIDHVRSVRRGRHDRD